MPRPSGLTLLTAILIVLLPALAVLQYRWVGQVSVAERERMQRNLRNAAQQFREAFDLELGRAFLSVQVDPTTARDGASEQYSDRYDTWLDTAEHPQIVSEILLVDTAGGALRVRRWNALSHSFEVTVWPDGLDKWRPDFERELENFNAGRPVDRRLPMNDDDSLLAAPIRSLVLGTGRGPESRREPVRLPATFGFTIVRLDMRYIREQILPSLAQRHIMHTDGDSYRVAVTAADDPSRVIYKSDPDAPIDPTLADATESIFGRGGPIFFFARGNEGSRRDAGRRFLGSARSGDDQDIRSERGRFGGDSGRWRLLVQHRSGSLEAAVGNVRRRNLAISFGVLLLLSVSVALLALSSRRAQRLARQQMEFVAGVSHELRTPVAVIRSAAENLSQGVISSGDRVKRYGEMIESEARRLGEMVERVLQYAGIESGLGLGERVSLAPADLIESAIESAVSSASPHDVNTHREIASDLPPVIGDAAALRSAIQNLIVNAIKYGGSDRWVGIRAEHVGGRRPEVRITVSDHGQGIAASELPHIFEPFYRGADAAARQVHGNGLGLSLVQRIVAAHGGRVTVSTRPPVGTAFTISLPAALPDSRRSPLSNEASAAVNS